jgi:diguanylate cyclase (GGDEF)-like protein
MTGLPSRHALEAVLERERLIAQLSRVPASVVKLAISSKQGAAGRDMMDRIMGLVAERLSPEVDRSFFLGRFSGDQFLVVMPGADELHAAERASAWIKAVVGRPIDVGGRPWKAPLFGGVAECLAEERRDEWVFRADEAMEAAEAQTQRRAMRYSEL